MGLFTYDCIKLCYDAAEYFIIDRNKVRVALRKGQQAYKNRQCPPGSRKRVWERREMLGIGSGTEW